MAMIKEAAYLFSFKILETKQRFNSVSSSWSDQILENLNKNVNLIIYIFNSIALILKIYLGKFLH
jgi:hypothetical protein